MKLLHLAAGVAVSILALTLPACSNKSDKVADTVDETAQEATDAVEDATDIPAVTVIEHGQKLPKLNGKPQILDFNATWCGPCRRFAPTFEMIAETYRNDALFFSIDVDSNPEIAAEYNVESIPTVVYISPDGSYTTTVGALDTPDFNNAVKQFLGK